MDTCDVSCHNLSALQLYHSLQSVRQGIHSLSLQLEKGFIDLSGGPARASDGFKDTIDTYSRLLAQGARVICIGEGGVGKSSLINYILKTRMQSSTEYGQANQTDRDKIVVEVLHSQPIAYITKHHHSYPI
jgi:ribosome biogenesis GTPase A